jgi:hypothetical protein
MMSYVQDKIISQLSLEDLRTFYGFILVRKGPYQGAVFKFQLVVPPEYNDRNAWLHITFLNYVYNPHVDPTTLELDLQSAFPVWDPHKHYLVTVLTYLKKKKLYQGLFLCHHRTSSQSRSQGVSHQPTRRVPPQGTAVRAAMHVRRHAIR